MCHKCVQSLDTFWTLYGHILDRFVLFVLAAKPRRLIGHVWPSSSPELELLDIEATKL